MAKRGRPRKDAERIGKDKAQNPKRYDKREFLPSLRLGSGPVDRYLANWWDETKDDGKSPSTILKLILYAALTRTSPFTGKPISVDIVQTLQDDRAESRKDESGKEQYGSLWNIEV